MLLAKPNYDTLVRRMLILLPLSTTGVPKTLITIDHLIASVVWVDRMSFKKNSRSIVYRPLLLWLLALD